MQKPSNFGVNQLLRALDVANTAKNPNQQIAAWTRVLQLEPGANPWPFNQPTRKEFLGKAFAYRGLAHMHLSFGDLDQNLEKAIADFDAAIELTRKGYRYNWALSQMTRAKAFRTRKIGEKDRNLETAINGYSEALKVFTRKRHPLDWAIAQAGRAIAYSDWMYGNRADNLDRAIDGFDSSLGVFLFESRPNDWAFVQLNRAMAYFKRINGDRSSNLEHAISGCDAALHFFSYEAFPEQWATAKLKQASARLDLMRGKPSSNIDLAIAGFDDALKFFTKTDFGHIWATIQTDRAVAYAQRLGVERANNIERAISGFESALQFFTRDAFPQQWAITLTNLSAPYLRRIDGRKEDNVELAISACDQALDVFNKDTSSEYWALAHASRGNAFFVRAYGARLKNLNSARASFEEALKVWTLDVDPFRHLQTSSMLGRTRSAIGDWEGALLSFQQARRAADLLVGRTLDVDETERVIEHARYIGPGMALASVRVGKLNDALAHLDAGRARQLALGISRNRAREALPPVEQVEFDLRLSAFRDAQAALAETNSGFSETALAAVASTRAMFEEVLNRGQALSAFREPQLDQHLENFARAEINLAAPVFTDDEATLLIVRSGNAPEAIDLANHSIKSLSQLLTNADDGWLESYFATQSGDLLSFRSSIEMIGDKLWSLFAGDLVAALDARGVQPGSRLALLPQGTLGLLPLGLARDPISGERLMDRYELTLSPSLAAVDERTEPKQVSLLTVIDPTGDLPAAPVEGALAADLFGELVVRLVGQDATRAAVLEALNGKSHWHFACHGTFDWQNARKSGLQLANGEALTLGDILDATALIPPRLVVLSACETGLHDISRNAEEFLGLPVGFIERGAKGVLATLWPVNDVSTALLIHRFFELHIKEAKRPAAALKAAQAWLRDLTETDLAVLFEAMNDVFPTGICSGTELNRRVGAGNTPITQKSKPFEHPYFWAGFTVYGG